MRYIDADKLQLYLNDYAMQVSPSEGDDEKTRKWNEIVYMTIDTCMKAVDEQPTADVRENVRGYWKKRKDKPLQNWYQCSNCGAICGETPKYCSECGAEMRGDKS